MEMVKKNIVSIICGVVAVIAIVALIWPISGWYTDLKAEADKHAKVAGDIDSVLHTSRTIPAAFDNDAAQPQPLPVFPTRDVIEKGEEWVKRAHAQAQAAMDAVVRLNSEKHLVLLTSALPRPSQEAPYDFRKHYNAVMQRGGKPLPISGAGTRGPAPENIPDEILQSTVAPTEDEIVTALNTFWQEKYAPQIIESEVTGPNGTEKRPLNFQAVLDKFKNDAEQYVKDFRKNRTTRFKTYLDRDALTQAANMDVEQAGGRPPSADEMWYAQMIVWVQQDIARAIRDMNQDVPVGVENGGIQQSRVKHLKRIEMGTAASDMYYTAASASGQSGGATPTEGDTAAAAPAGKVYTRSVTGRVSNPMYDVVHSHITVVMDERSVRDFIRMLERNRLITVLEVKQSKVDNNEARDVGFEYGDAPVVQLSIHLEHLFLRAWTTPLMPDTIKKALGVTPAAGAEGTAGTVAASQ